MEIHDLAKSYHDLKVKTEEKRRVLDYDYPRKLKDLESKAFDVESRLRVGVLEDEIKNEEKFYQQQKSELDENEEELKKMLSKVKANSKDRLVTHMHGQIFLDTYVDDEGNIISNTYHKVS